MARAEKIIGLLPCIYGAGDRTKLINKVVRDFASPMDEADGHLFRIQRAHRIDVAENLGDLIRLAALLRLGPEYFEDLVELATTDYKTALERLRQRIRRLAGLHLGGLGTARAILESSAILLDAEILGNAEGGDITRITQDGFSHKIYVQLPNRPNGETDQIALHENPVRRVRQDLLARWPLDGWAIENKNVTQAPARFVVKGIADRTLQPSVFCSETDTGFLFNGVVPDGSVLVFDQYGSATLDGKPVDDWVIRFDGGVVGFDSVYSAAVSVDHGEAGEPFNGDVERLGNSASRSKKPPLTLATGRTNWHFDVASGVYQGSRMDYCIYDIHPDPVGTFEDQRFDECVFDYQAHAEVGLSWNERVHCAFKLVVPQYFGPDSEVRDRDAAGRYANLIGQFVSRFKAAGIRAYVSPDRDAWIIGKSRLRAMDALEGEGASFRRPLLWREQTDRTLPFDVS